MNLFLSFDFFSPRPTLYYKSRERYQTIFGCIMTLIAVSAMASFIIYFFVDFIKGKEMHVIASKETYFEKEYKLNDHLFFYKLTDSLGNTVPNSIAKVIPTLWKFTEEKVQSKELSTVKCTEDVLPKETLQNFKEINFTDYHCFPSSEEVNILNKKSPTLNQYMNFYIAKCTDSPGCESEEAIEQFFKKNSLFFSVYVESVGVDHENKKNPIVTTYVNHQYRVPVDMFYVTYFFFRKIEYHSDDGLLFQKMNKYNSFFFDSEKRMSDIYTQGTVTSYPNTMMVVQFNIYEDYAEKYTRIYSKFQSFLANAGGIANLIVTIVQIIAVSTSRGMMQKDIIIESQSSLKTNTGINSSNFSFSGSFLNSQKKSIISKGIDISGSLEHKTRKSTLAKISIDQKINLCHSLMFYLFFCLRTKAKFKILNQCDALVRKRLSCEEIIKFADYSESTLLKRGKEDSFSIIKYYDSPNSNKKKVS